MCSGFLEKTRVIITKAAKLTQTKTPLIKERRFFNMFFAIIKSAWHRHTSKIRIFLLWLQHRLL